MPELRLHGREVRTVFDLLGEKENDLTYALGWALAHSERLLVSLLADVLGADAGEPSAVRLQEYGGADGGFTDIEIETNKRRVARSEARLGSPRSGPAEEIRTTPADARRGHPRRLRMYAFVRRLSPA